LSPDALTIVAGLGNPEKDYKNTRHNIGFETIDKLACDHDIKIKRAKFRAHYGEGRIGGGRVCLVKPQAYMNLSGECIRDILNFYKLTPENLIVVYDDKDLSPGDIRVREKGSAGSHNGMKNIIYQLETDRIVRVRIGIGTGGGKITLRDYVLGKIGKSEAADLTDGVAKAGRAVETILAEGPVSAMNMFNAKRAEENKTHTVTAEPEPGTGDPR